MKLDVMTKCGPLSATGVDGEAVEQFLNAYEDAEDGDVLRVPVGSETRTLLVDRGAVFSVDADEDDAPEPEPEPEPEAPAEPEEPAEETDAEGVETTEESSTS